jgi:hypothetical protein
MFVIGGEINQSVEGTTPGDPLALSMYAIVILPLIRTIGGIFKQVWFADDDTGAGCVESVQTWWTTMTEFCPAYGYHANAHITWLIVKEGRQIQVQRCFEGAGILMSTTDRRQLGAALGSPLFVEKYVKSKGDEWFSQVTRLSDIAVTQPHAAYAAFVHGLSGRWLYLIRTVEGISTLLRPYSKFYSRNYRAT